MGTRFDWDARYTFMGTNRVVMDPQVHDQQKVMLDGSPIYRLRSGKIWLTASTADVIPLGWEEDGDTHNTHHCCISPAPQLTLPCPKPPDRDHGTTYSLLLGIFGYTSSLWMHHPPRRTQIPART